MFLRFLILALLLVPSHLLAKDRLVVFAASSQTDAMAQIGMAFEKECDCEVIFSLAASSVLARQVDAGAGAGVFISASVDWVDWLNERDKIRSSVPFIGNRLVLISGKKISSPETALNAGKFAMADPRSVPAGVYARQALQSAKIWDAVKARAVFTENVRIALKLVTRGDLEAGIVYQSDVHQLSSGENLSKYVFPDESHTRIKYVAAQVQDKPLAKAFVSFLKSGKAQKILEGLGFLLLSDKESE